MENMVLQSFIETTKNHLLKVNYEFIKEANYNDYLYIANLTRPPLTTLFVPRYRIGKEAAEVLFRIL